MSSSGQPSDNSSMAATSAEPRLCAGNCGFYGSSATMDLCSLCFKAFILRQSASHTPATTTTTATSENHETNQVSAPATTAEAALPNRCTKCRRKVGMLGFSCKCGGTFCGTHRFPDLHECDFDFKGVGRQKIKDSNPVVRADKLDRF